MSWSITGQIEAKSVAEAKAIITASDAPQSIKDYLSAGVDAVAAAYGADVLVNVVGHGVSPDESNCGAEAVYSTMDVRRYTDA